ncbi:MAG TPA: GNAT family N-acetyltransferase [Gaiellaceae bacterium]|nr:GNAT family N-acetyltransferase [Gaiellaceae bacterium]
MADATIRRLRAGDEDVIRALAEAEPRTALLADPKTIFLAAFAGDEPVGFVVGYELARRHGDAEMLFVYELDVAEPYRRRGLATRLMRELLDVAEEDGVTDAFVLTEPGNEAANALYGKLGGRRSGVHMYEWSPGI